MDELLSEEEFGWVLVYRDSWRPRGPKGEKGAVLASPVRLPGRRWPYEAIIWAPDGRIFLVDALTYGLLVDADGVLTARELVEKNLADYIKVMPEDDEFRMLFEKDPSLLSEEEKYRRDGIIAAYYAQLALLKKLGLLI